MSCMIKLEVPNPFMAWDSWIKSCREHCRAFVLGHCTRYTCTTPRSRELMRHFLSILSIMYAVQQFTNRIRYCSWLGYFHARLVLAISWLSRLIYSLCPCHWNMNDIKINGFLLILSCQPLPLIFHFVTRLSRLRDSQKSFLEVRSTRTHHSSPALPRWRW